MFKINFSSNSRDELNDVVVEAHLIKMLCAYYYIYLLQSFLETSRRLEATTSPTDTFLLDMI